MYHESLPNDQVGFLFNHPALLTDGSEIYGSREASSNSSNPNSGAMENDIFDWGVDAKPEHDLLDYTFNNEISSQWHDSGMIPRDLTDVCYAPYIM